MLRLHILFVAGVKYVVLVFVIHLFWTQNLNESTVIGFVQHYRLKKKKNQTLQK